MNSGASLSSPHITAAPSRPPVSPLVLVDGQPRTDLAASELDRRGPLDERFATLVFDSAASATAPQRAAWVRDLAGRTVTILSPIALDGGGSRLIVEASGRVGDIDDEALGVTDAWSDQLDEPMDHGLNRGATLGELLRADVSIDTLEPAIVNATLPTRVLNASTLRDALRIVCETFGLVVHRDLRWFGGRVIETRSLRSIRHGRPLSLAMPTEAHPIGEVASLSIDTRPDRPRKFIARADHAIAESTFTLIPGWGEADENLADAEYDRTLAADFPAVSSVFRLWVLNEDGSFGGTPFDANALFADPRPIPAVPTPLRPAMTLDESGRSVGIVIERSTDAGVSWQPVTDRVDVLGDRAGVYFDDDTLDTAWLDAVRAGEARVRATASLRHPLPLETIRWRGNPFHGSFVEHAIELGDAFSYRSVTQTSRFRGEIDSGERAADETDDRGAMAEWLAMRAAQTPPIRGSARIELTRIDRGVRIGGRIENIVASDTEHLSGDLHDALLTVTRVRHRIDRAATELTCDVRARR